MLHHPNIHFTYLISSTILGGVLFQYPIGLLSDRYKKLDLLIGLNVVIAVILPLCVIFFHTIGLVPLLMILGGCLFSIYPLTITLACERFERKDYFNIVQTLLLIYSFGCIASPIIVTQLFLNIFTNLMFGIFAAIFIINAILLIYTVISETP